MSVCLVGVNQLHANPTFRIRIHIRILARVLLTNIAPRSRLPYVIAQLFIRRNRLLQIVYGHAQMLNPFMVRLQKVSIDVRWCSWRNNPLVGELVVVLVANIERERQRLVAIS